MMDKDQITKKQYELIMEIMQLDTRRSFNSILNELGKRTTPQKRTFFLYRLKGEALAKKVKNNEKKGEFTLLDMLNFQKAILNHFKESQVGKDDFDLSQYASYYGDDIIPILEREVDFTISLLKMPNVEANDHLNLKNLKIDSMVCPYCNIPLRETRNHKLVFVFKDGTQMNSATNIEQVCHLKCLLVSTKKE